MGKLKFGVGTGVALLFLMVMPVTAVYASGGRGNLGAVQKMRPFVRPISTSTSGSAIVDMEQSPYGPVLVVGGAGAGYTPATPSTPAGYAYPAGTSLYVPSIDPTVETLPYQAGCNTTTEAISPLEEGGSPPYPPFTCAGSELDPTADWPAFTTDGPPIPGPGVDAALLGRVYRTDIGAFQVTYAGHPLYLFDPGPDSFAGEDFIETVEPLFPWHTAWFLMSPDGLVDPGPANLEVESPVPGTTVYSSNVLAVEVLPNIGIPGGVPMAVYSFSGDSPGASRCLEACARDFIPLTTTGQPTEQPGVSAQGVGVIPRPDGSNQVTYDGHPLYIYSQEQPVMNSSGGFQTAGNGNLVSAFGGTFSLVTP
jgi:predicted lipoprotein with Yx(FWY)xxD motif